MTYLHVYCTDCRDIVSVAYVGQHTDQRHPGMWASLTHHQPTPFALEPEPDIAEQLDRAAPLDPSDQVRATSAE